MELLYLTLGEALVKDTETIEIEDLCSDRPPVETGYEIHEVDTDDQYLIEIQEA